MAKRLFEDDNYVIAIEDGSFNRQYEKKYCKYATFESGYRIIQAGEEETTIETLDVVNWINSENGSDTYTEITLNDFLRKHTSNPTSIAITDPSLQNNIDAEEAARIAADQNINTNLNTEISNRTSGDINLQSQIDQEILDRIEGDKYIYFSIGGGYLLDPNEFNGWGLTGVYDDIITHDLGNVGANVSRFAGGLCFPFQWRIKRFYAWHYNNNAQAQAWGWRINKQTKTADANTVTNVEILRECTGAGATAIAPRNYLNTTTQQTDIDLSTSQIIEAFEVVSLGVEAPTAVTENRYVYVFSGFFEIEKIN